MLRRRLPVARDPDCGDRQCGTDSLGAVCGTCPRGSICKRAGYCEASNASGSDAGVADGSN